MNNADDINSTHGANSSHDANTLGGTASHLPRVSSSASHHRSGRTHHVHHVTRNAAARGHRTHAWAWNPARARSARLGRSHVTPH